MSVAQEGSITKTAQRLGYMQSNVTARIQLLESEVNTQLFYMQHGMLLTSIGVCDIAIIEFNNLDLLIGVPPTFPTKPTLRRKWIKSLLFTNSKPFYGLLIFNGLSSSDSRIFLTSKLYSPSKLICSHPNGDICLSKCRFIIKFDRL